MIFKVVGYALSVLIAAFTISLSPASESSANHHEHMDHGSAATICAQRCTVSDRPQAKSKIQEIVVKRQSEPRIGAVIAASSLVIASYYRLRTQKLYKFASWRPPDKVLLSGLHHTSL